MNAAACLYLKLICFSNDILKNSIQQKYQKKAGQNVIILIRSLLTGMHEQALAGTLPTGVF